VSEKGAALAVPDFKKNSLAQLFLELVEGERCRPEINFAEFLPE